MYSISSTNVDADLLRQLRQWFVSEWGEVDPFVSDKSDMPIPPAVVATENNKLIGGLSFTIATKPESQELGIWINAVLVSPEYRRVGLGSRLIQAAQLAAKAVKVRQLFVYTDVPELYKKLGWQILATDGESTVLEKTM